MYDLSEVSPVEVISNGVNCTCQASIYYLLLVDNGVHTLASRGPTPAKIVCKIPNPTNFSQRFRISKQI